MTQASLFISYKHGDPSSQIAKRFHDYLDAVSDALDFELFMDDEANRAGDDWQQNIDRALADCTHFVALLDTSYWRSPACQYEVCKAVERFESSGAPRLLFVMAEDICAEFFTFDKSRRTGRLNSANPILNAVGDLHFLGPFDESTRLVPLAWENRPLFNKQLAQLLGRLERVL